MGMEHGARTKAEAFNNRAETQKDLLKPEPEKAKTQEFTDVHPATILDFKGIHLGVSYEDIIAWAQKEKGIILQIEDPKERKRLFHKLDLAFQRAKDFLIDSLHYSKGELNKGPKHLNSEKDVFNLLHNSYLFKKMKGLSPAKPYCRLVKGTYIAHELTEKGVDSLFRAKKIFESMIVSEGFDGDGDVPPLFYIIHEDGKGMKIQHATRPIVAFMESRAKAVEGAMLKFTTRPESSAKVALKDAIASRFTIKEKDAISFLPELCKWLQQYVIDKDDPSIVIENDSFFSDEQLEIVNAELKKLGLHVTQNIANPTSSGDFIALKITGVLGVPRIKKEVPDQEGRQFEIQIVPFGNRNEKGRGNHYVMDVAKKVAARTRLDGYCTEEAFISFVKEAREFIKGSGSDMSEETIIGYLTEGENSRIIKKSEGKKIKYFARYMLERWQRLGLEPKNL